VSVSLPPFDYIMCAAQDEKIIRWYESDLPWGHLNEEGETETEGIDDSDEDDDHQDD
jgi:hypothetical protein